MKQLSTQYILDQSPVDGHLSCFQVLAIINSAAMNTGLDVSFRIRVFVFSGHMHRSEIAGPYDNSIFSFKRTAHSGLHSGCTSLHSEEPFLIGQLSSLLTLSSHSLPLQSMSLLVPRGNFFDDFIP